MPQFSVDTHLFRELGELLVGRASTALAELVKNAYDADATEVLVHGEHLSASTRAKIVITDNGSGMDPVDFEKGFLRVASRLKEEGDRRSKLYKRRFTGAKGVGRLAAHKLARHLQIESVPRDPAKDCVVAMIDWDLVESCQTLDDIPQSNALSIKSYNRPQNAKCGTTITLTRLRSNWTQAELTRFFQEMEGFRAPDLLLKAPILITRHPSLLGDVDPADVSPIKGVANTNFSIQLTGEFDAGEDYWQALGEAADWILEIDATGKTVRYAISPTKRLEAELHNQGANARKIDSTSPHPSPSNGPFFKARILIREGSGGMNSKTRAWAAKQSGVRVFVEGFRVLPYGEPNEDWLSIDSDYVKRDRSLNLLSSLAGAPTEADQEGLQRVTKHAYLGAVFIKQNDARGLQMLVNREGFLPNQSYLDLITTVKTGINLSVRVRAAARAPLRQQRSELRKEIKEPSRLELKAAVEDAVNKAKTLASEARSSAAIGDFDKASAYISAAASQFEKGAETGERLVTERETMQILASLGLHMSGFVHEVRGLLGITQAVSRQIERLRNSLKLDPEQRRELAELSANIGELQRVVERQAANLTEITAPDARRRRTRFKLADRFEAASRLLTPQAERLGITITNRIPPELRSPPFFSAELMLVFANVLSNAIKAAGTNGRVTAYGAVSPEGESKVKLENTGVAVDLKDAERWFRPFESSTASTDPKMGQGMGMGLTITRHLLEEYGANIQFTSPTKGYSTAIEITFPK